MMASQIVVCLLLHVALGTNLRNGTTSAKAGATNPCGGCSSCVAVTNPSQGGISDAVCAPCGRGQTWWPCNTQVAQCMCGGDSPTPPTTPSPTSGEATPMPTQRDGEWQWWSGTFDGITYHIPASAYSIERYCSSGQPIGDMCWRLANDQEFTQVTLPSFCARQNEPGVMIAFGHPDHQQCGECSELRVQRRDGTYNKVIVMTTDHPTDTNTSPELSTSGKAWLDKDTVNGVACPLGGGPASEDCKLDDRLRFEYRKVDCLR